ncbi:MAG: D-2-hydroxyacid dehydrogenase [Acidobacteria bacterium]|nr:D-2-hydroxyacid dehydrogenase [Acidobacteriota bacterium]
MKIALRVVLLAAACLAAQGQSKKVVATGLSPAELDELRKGFPQVSFVSVGPNYRVRDPEEMKRVQEQMLKEVADADAAFGTITPAMVRAGKKLKWFQSYSAGVETYLHLSTPELRDSDIVITNAKIIQGPNIADHAFALLLALTRDLYKIIPSRPKQEWSREQHNGVIELSGKTAVIVGVGGIGSQIAVRASAFGMRVIGVDPKDISYTPFVAKVVPPDRIDSVLPEADVVFISAPHTPQSHNMIGPRQFDLMKRGAYFIAVSRGSLYNTEALVRALDSRRLAGAGLDVTNPEPLPKGHALWNFDNVIITPHIAGASDQVQRRRVDLVKENMRRFLAGEPLLNVVDKKKGY